MLKRDFFYHGTDQILKKIDGIGIWGTDREKVAEEYGKFTYILNVNIKNARICILPFSIVKQSLKGKQWITNNLDLDNFDVLIFTNVEDELPKSGRKGIYNQIFIKSEFIKHHYRVPTKKKRN